eukprot:scaffold20334_cov92-Phaeocystis_antarctica.AAC.1
MHPCRRAARARRGRRPGGGVVAEVFFGRLRGCAGVRPRQACGSCVGRGASEGLKAELWSVSGSGVRSGSGGWHLRVWPPPGWPGDDHGGRGGSRHA